MLVLDRSRTPLEQTLARESARPPRPVDAPSTRWSPYKSTRWMDVKDPTTLYVRSGISQLQGLIPERMDPQLGQIRVPCRRAISRSQVAGDDQKPCINTRSASIQTLTPCPVRRPRDPAKS